MGLGSVLFGGSNSKRVNTLDSDQVEYQQKLIQAGSDVLKTTARSNYAGDMARNSLSDVLGGMRDQKNQGIATSRISNRMHSSGQRARENRLNQGFNQAMNTMKYQHQTQQQNWKQNYDQQAQNWNLSGKYQMASMLGQQGLQSRFDTVQQKTPGLFDYVSGVSGAVGAISGMM